MKEEYKKETYSPTKKMKKEAQRGLDLRKEHGRGGTAVGIARARDISNGKQLPIETVARMYSFFKRHEVDKEVSGWKPGEKNYPSNGLIAWLLWGGDSGFKWSTRIWEKHKEENKSLSKLEILINENSSDELINSILATSKEFKVPLLCTSDSEPKIKDI